MKNIKYDAAAKRVKPNTPKRSDGPASDPYSLAKYALAKSIHRSDLGSDQVHQKRSDGSASDP